MARCNLFILSSNGSWVHARKVPWNTLGTRSYYFWLAYSRTKATPLCLSGEDKGVATWDFIMATQWCWKSLNTHREDERHDIFIFLEAWHLHLSRKFCIYMYLFRLHSYFDSSPHSSMILFDYRPHLWERFQYSSCSLWWQNHSGMLLVQLMWHSILDQNGGTFNRWYYTQSSG